MGNEHDTVAKVMFIIFGIVITWLVAGLCTEISYTDDICKAVSVKTDDYLKCRDLDKPHTLKLLKETVQCQKQQ